MSAPLARQDRRPGEGTLVGWLARQARERPAAVALREKHRGRWREITWSAYLQEVAATACALAELGVEPGTAVAILSDNRPEWLYADLGTQLLGARAVGIYPTNPADEVAWLLAHCGAVVLVAEDQEQVDKAVEVAGRTPRVRRVVAVDPRGLHDVADPRLVTWEAFLARGRERLEADPGFVARHLERRTPDEGTMVVYTSGTTGRPKGAVLSPRNALAAAEVLRDLLRVGPEDLLLSYLPLCHVAEKIFSLFLPLVGGAVVHFGESIETVQEDLREVAPTIFLGVPRIWEKMHAGVELRMRDSGPLQRFLFDRCLAWRLADAGRRGPLAQVRAALGDLLVFGALQERLGLRRCRIAVSGAAPIAPELVRWFNAVGVPLLEGYGQTECAGVSHVNPPDASRVGTVGRVLPVLEDRIAEDGEILVRGPCVFQGYLHDPEATAATVDADGWLHTGDLGSHDADGYLRITGRKKEILITRGGKNLSPERIENALKLSPYVKEAVAVGDGRRYVTALIQVDRDAVADWATRRGVPAGAYPDLVARPEVVELVREAVEAANARLARVEQVRRFRLLPAELNEDAGELTPTRKVRRRVVLERYRDLVEEMYG